MPPRHSPALSGNSRRKATRAPQNRVGRRSVAAPPQPPTPTTPPTPELIATYQILEEPYNSSDDDEVPVQELIRRSGRPYPPTDPSSPGFFMRVEPANRVMSLMNGSEILFRQAFSDPRSAADIANAVDGTMELGARFSAFLSMLAFLSTTFNFEPPAPVGLTRAQLKDKTEVRKPTAEDRGQQCAVCCSGLPGRCNVSLLPKCGHTFHTKCINPWLSKNVTCPLCRSNVLAEPESATQ